MYIKNIKYKNHSEPLDIPPIQLSERVRFGCGVIGWLFLLWLLLL